MLHRDISGGNILILPKVTGRTIKWTGLLTDWEMSKPTDYKGVGRQPERTVSSRQRSNLALGHSSSTPQGTWQFLSVALLSFLTIIDQLRRSTIPILIFKRPFKHAL